MTKPRDNVEQNQDGYLDGQLLIAMPTMSDGRFAQTVIYLCAHSNEGAMGLVLNKPNTDITFSDLLERLELLPADKDAELKFNGIEEISIHEGGPVETGRGFVLHSPDYYATDTTFSISGDICLTATVDILKAIATGDGPEHAILALGYAGWSAGQLEGEIHANGWLHAPATPELVFSGDDMSMYSQALAAIGVDPLQLVSDAGHA